MLLRRVSGAAKKRPLDRPVSTARRHWWWMTVLPAMVAITVSVACPGVASASTDLGYVGFGAIAVDNARHHVYVSAPLANEIDEFNFAGGLIGKIDRVYGAWGMTINGNYLYAAESTAGAIVRINLTQSHPVSHAVASGLNEPVWLVMTAGKLWTTVDGSQWARVVSVDPRTGAKATVRRAFYDPDLAVSAGDPHTLFVAEDGLSPGAVYRYNVATGRARLSAKNTFTDQENIEQLVVSAGGKRVIPAAGAPYLFEELSASTLMPDGLRYPGQPYPSAVAVSASGRLATALDNGYSQPDVSVYPLGVPSAIWSVSTNNNDGTANVLPHGLALSANGSKLFVVTASCTNYTAGASETFLSAFSLNLPPPHVAGDTCR